MPELSPYEQAVFGVFLDCHEIDAYNYVGGEMGPRRRESLRHDVAKDVARAYGIPWRPSFIKRLYRCAREFLVYDARRLEGEIENAKFLREGSAVN